MQQLQYFARAIIICLLIANAYSSDKEARTNIVGGYIIDIEDVPYQVAILLYERLWCGGSILTNKYVLSAAHCVLDSANLPLIIHAGTSIWAKPASIHHVDMSITYGTSETVDVAILRVTEPFIFDAKHQPVKLIPYGREPRHNEIATVIGWGTTSSTSEISNVLMAADLPIVDRRLCNISYHGDIAISEICAGSFEKDSCQGDSGGPLILNGFQIGIVSMGAGCGLPAFPGIYANVSYFYNWIMDQISV